jgi:hypothetical protein
MDDGTVAGVGVDDDSVDNDDADGNNDNKY